MKKENSGLKLGNNILPIKEISLNRIVKIKRDNAIFKLWVFVYLSIQIRVQKI